MPLLPAPAPPVGWHLPDFDDCGWQAGRLGLGYGDGDDLTSILVNAEVDGDRSVADEAFSTADGAVAVAAIDADGAHTLNRVPPSTMCACGVP